MGVLRDRRVILLLVLVLAGSGLSVMLALHRPEVQGVSAPPSGTGDEVPGFRSADLVGPGGDALATAVTALSASLSYDHRDLDGSLARATEQLTPAYAATIDRKFDEKFRTSVTRGGLVVEGLVRGAGVVRTRGDTDVVCLLYVDQLLLEGPKQSADDPPTVLKRYRARVEVLQDDAGWRVDEIALTEVDDVG